MYVNTKDTRSGCSILGYTYDQLPSTLSDIAQSIGFYISSCLSMLCISKIQLIFVSNILDNLSHFCDTAWKIVSFSSTVHKK